MFFKSEFIDSDVATWHLKCWAWLIDATGGLEDLQHSTLVLPTNDFFPKTDTEGHVRAEFILDCIKQAARMDDWQIRLVPQRRLAGRVSALGHVQNGSHPAGTFSAHGNRGQITYDPDLLNDPIRLIATLAHELGHYLNGTFKYPPPEGIRYIEPATDVTSCFLGFGVFGANAAFNFRQFTDFDSQGWETNRLGYLSQREWLLDLAIFVELANADPAAAKSALKPELRGDFHRAQKYLAAQSSMETLINEIGRH
ncbi:MAG: hypothetical protein AAF216_06255 [Pseudomonadota bacterium]